MTDHERDAVQETIDSEGYKLIEERLRVVLERERAALESREASEGTFRAHQGAVAALRVALGLPRDMLAEDEPQTSRGKR